MFITNEDFNNLKSGIDVLSKYESTIQMQEVVTLHMAQETLDKLKEKRTKDNKRKAEYIAEKRKIDKTYGGNDYSKRKMNKANK